MSSYVLSNPISRLIESLTHVIREVNIEASKEFTTSLKASLAVSSQPVDFVVGLPEKQVVFCISQALQHVSDTTASTPLARQIWNPIVASLVECVSKLSLRVPTSQYGKGDYKKPTPKVSPSKVPPLATRKKSADRPELQQATSSLDELVITEPIANGPAPSTSSGSKRVVLESVQRKEIFEQVYKPGATIFPSQLKTQRMRDKKRMGFVDCKVLGCSVCRSHAVNIPLTRCSDIVLHKHGDCNKYGWYTHVVPGYWAHIKKAHKDGKHVDTTNMFRETTHSAPLSDNVVMKPKRRVSVEASPQPFKVRRARSVGEEADSAPQSPPDGNVSPGISSTPPYQMVPFDWNQECEKGN